MRLSCRPLLMEDSITQEYVEAIVADQRNRGLMMFLADGLVLAHAAIEKGVKQLDVSLCTFKHPVTFLNGKQARIIIVLCAEDQTKHIRILNDVLNIFSKRRVLSSWQHWKAVRIFKAIFVHIRRKLKVNARLSDYKLHNI